ncbi:MAG: CHAT domain-containing protein, partial [Pseudomonadota bacterium]
FSGDDETELGRCQRALAEARARAADAAARRIRYRIGQLLVAQQRYPEAIDVFTRLIDTIPDGVERRLRANALNHVGAIHQYQGRYRAALAAYREARDIARRAPPNRLAAMVEINIGTVHYQLRDYLAAGAGFARAESIFNTLDDDDGLTAVLENRALVRRALGDYATALTLFQAALERRRGADEPARAARVLHNIGFVYDLDDDDGKAARYYREALAAYPPGDQRVAATLNNLALVTDRAGRHDEALAMLERALAIQRELGLRRSVGYTLDSLGTVLASLQRFPEAWAAYLAALRIHRETGDPDAERVTLKNLGDLLDDRGNPEAAILFYKRSVNISEELRGRIKPLSAEQRASYAETLADAYRDLADLLLKSDRVLEAQRVLDLLKIQEVENFFGSVRGGDGGGVPTLSSEQILSAEFEQLYARAIQIGGEFRALSELTDPTPEQLDRLRLLMSTTEAFAASFNQFIGSEAVLAARDALGANAREQALDLAQLRSIGSDLGELGDGYVVFYPMIVDDRVELVLATRSLPVRRTSLVSRVELNTTIAAFRSALADPGADPEPLARKLYDWLIRPIAADLEQASAETIIYAPDGVLRYVPLAALHDGERWLLERFAVNNITSASLTKLSPDRPAGERVFAAAFATGEYSFEVAGRPFTFRGLPYAKREVEKIAAAASGNSLVLDGDFSIDRLKLSLGNHSIVHLATHAEFVESTPDSSFIVFGDGSYASLAQIRNWSMAELDMVILSACETAVGEDLGSGQQILGLGYVFQGNGVESTVATLWQISDGGTQILMSAFYQALRSGKSKLESLRAAQLSLIGLDDSVAADTLRAAELVGAVRGRLSHPYYWAPFIMIGSGV